MDATNHVAHDGSILEQYKHHSAKFLRQRLKEQINARQKITPGSTEVFASILFADISGFTQLSSRLSAEELKTHINEYFTKLLSVIDENSGDVVKFCGDAVLIMWALPLDSAEEEKQAAVLMSALCALQLLEECGEYKKTVCSGGNGSHHRSTAVGSSAAHAQGSSPAQPAVTRVLGARSKTVLNLGLHASAADTDGAPTSAASPPPAGRASETIVELSLHCGISCGAVHCMTLGDSQRMEFLLSGSPIQQMGAAEAAAHAGQVCVHPDAYMLVQDTLHALPVGDGSSAGAPASSAVPVAPADAEGKAPVSHEAAPNAAVEHMNDATTVDGREVAGLAEDGGTLPAPAAADAPPPPVAYLLSGKLADAYVEAQLRRGGTRSTQVKLSRSSVATAHGVDKRFAPGSPDLSEESDAFPAADMAGDSTTQYLANLARKVTASQTKPQLHRARGKISGVDVRLVAQGDGDGGAASSGGEAPNADANTRGLHSPSMQKASAFNTSARHGLLSRFRSSKLRASFATSLCSEGDSSDQMSNKESAADTGSVTAAGAQLSPTRTLSTGKTSFLYSGAPGEVGSPAHGVQAGRHGVRQQLQSRMSSALINTRSSLALLPMSWSSRKDHPSRTHTGSRSALSSAEEAAEERSVSRHHPSLRSVQKDPSRSGEERSWHRGSISWHRGASAITGASAGCPVVTEATCPTPSAQSRAALSRPLPVAVLKRRLKFGTAASFEAVRDYQCNWDRTAERADSGLSYPGAGRRDSTTLRRDSAMVSSKRVRLTQELRKFVHETAARAVDSGTVAFLSEVRDVAVVFTQVLDLERAFHLGQHGRPQKVFCAILRALRQFGGSLRQFVVDDKGCVAIGCFGLSGSSSQNNCVQAVDYALSLRALLQTLGSRSASGITLGTVYCGLVGAGSRCEYAVMGSSVNLAARLMAACAKELKVGDTPPAEGLEVSPNKRFTRAGTMLQRRQGVLIDASVHHVTHHQFQFEQLANIHAKGYVEPVKVFAALRKRSGSRQIDVSGADNDVVHQHQRASQLEKSSPLSLLLERDDALRSVQQCFARKLSSKAPHVSPSVPAALVVGSPGSGRSAFLRHAVSSLQAPAPGAVRIAEVRVDQANQYLPFDLVRELLAQVIGINVSGKRECTTDTMSEPAVDPILALRLQSRDAERVLSTRSSTVTTATRFSTLSVAAINTARARRSSVNRSQSTPWRRRGTVASSSTCEMPTDANRRRCSTGVTTSETRRSRARSMCGTIAESEPVLEPLSPHTLRFLPQRLATAIESAATTTTSSSGISTGSTEIMESANAKVQEWCAQHLPVELTLSAAFSLSHPSLDLLEVLLYQLRLRDCAGGEADGTVSIDSEEEILAALCQQPLRSVLHLLNSSLGTALSSDTATPCGPVSLAEAMQHFLSPELTELLTGVLLHVLLLAALGASLRPEGEAKEHPHHAGWTFVVDDLHLADLESQTLLCNVINTAQRLGTVHTGRACCGGILVTASVAEVAGAEAHRIATVSTVTHTQTNTTATPMAARPRKRRGSILHSVHCTSPADLLSHLSRPVDATQAHEQVMLLLKMHCEVVELQRLSLSAVRELLIHTLGARNWVWLLTHAAQALGAQSSHAHRPTEIGLHRGGSTVKGRRTSFITSPGSQRANTPSSRLQRVLASTVLPPSSEFVPRRNAVSASQARWNSVRSRFLSGRLHPDRRPSELTGTAGSTASVHSKDAQAMTAAAAAAAFHPSRTSAYCTQAEHDALVALIFALSGNGLPSYVTDICVSLRDTISCGAFTTIQEVPAVVRRSKLILEVLDGLSGVEVAVLKAAAVVGGAFAVPLLSATLAGMDLPQCSDVLMLGDVLRSLVSAGLVKAATPESLGAAVPVSPVGGASSSVLYEFAQTSTQLAIYNLMLEAQRAAAHSVIAAYLEHTHRCLCAPPQLLQIAHHYHLSGNTKKKIEYLQRTADLFVLQGNISDAIGNYAEMAHCAMGSSVEEIVEACRTLIIDRILAVRSSTRQLTAFSGAAAPARASPTGPPMTVALAAVWRSLRFRLFSNKVVSADEETAKVRPSGRQPVNRVSPNAASGQRHARLHPPMAPVGIALADPAEASLSALSLAELVLRWKVSARTLSAVGGNPNGLCTSPADQPRDIKVKDSVALLGIGLADVAGWASRVADLLQRTGREEEALELTALALVLLEQSAKSEPPNLSASPAPASPQASRPQRRRSLLLWAAQDDEDVPRRLMSSSDRDSHDTRAALRYLEKVTSLRGQQRTRSVRDPVNALSRLWSRVRAVQAWVRATGAADADGPPLHAPIALIHSSVDPLHSAVDDILLRSALLVGDLAAATHSPVVAEAHCPVPSAPCERGTNLLLRLAVNALVTGRAVEAIVALEPVLLHDPDYQCRECWAVMSAALRCLASRTEAVRCLDRALSSASAEDPSDTVGFITAWHLSASGHISDALRCLSTAALVSSGRAGADVEGSGGTRPVGNATLVASLTLRAWLLILSGSSEAAQKTVARIRTHLLLLAADASSTEEPAYVREAQWLQQLEMMLYICDSGGSAEGPPAALLCAEEQEAGQGYHAWVTTTLRVYYHLLRSAGRDTAPMSTSQVSTALGTIISQLRGGNVTERTDARTTRMSGTLPDSESARVCTSLPAGVLSFLSLHTSMKQLQRILSALLAAGLNDAEEAHQEEILAAVTAIAHAMAGFKTLCTGAFAALRPMHAILTVQYELLFHQLCAYLSGGGGSSRSSLRYNERTTRALAPLVLHVFPPGSFKAAPTSTSQQGSPVRVKPQASSPSEQQSSYEYRAGSKKNSWWRLFGLRGGRDRAVADLSALGSREWGSPDRGGNLVTPSALLDYQRGFSVAKLQRLRAFVQSHVRADPDLAVDPCRQLTNCCRATRRSECEVGSADNGGDGDCGTSDEESSGSQESYPAEPAAVRSGGKSHARGVHSRLRGGQTVQVSSATNTGASAAELFLPSAEVDKHAGVRWELFPFVRRIYDGLLQELDALEERTREELCRYVTQLMERMECS